jgi:hypothetical protein
LKLSNHNQVHPEHPRRKIAAVAGGLTLFSFLLVVGGWFLFNLGKQPSPIASARTTGSAAEESSLEGAAQADAQGTPSPGFADDFEDGLSSNWTVHYGDPFISEGRLTSNVGAGMAAGDVAWKNYRIEFDVDTSQVDCSFVDTANSLGVRVQDFEHAYWFVFTNCNSGWSLFVGGFPDLLPDTAVNTSNDVKHFSIHVDETKLSAYENGSLISSITDERFQTGNIFLQIEARTYYDNFQVTLLP